MNEMSAASEFRHAEPASPNEPAEILRRRHGMLGGRGYTVPELTGARQFSFEAVANGAVPNLKLMSQEFGTGNSVWLAEGATPTRELRIHTLARTANAIIVIGHDLSLKGDIHVMGDEQTVVLTGGRAEVGHSGQVTAQIWGRRSVLFIGEKTTSNGSTFILSGDDCHILVGDDCMFANGIHISTHDEHAVMDIASRSRVNQPGSVLIEPHVWLGRNTTVVKKVQLGLGSVVGAHSLVTKGCPRFSVIGGAPAKVIRTGSTWDRWALGRAETVDRVLALADEVPLPVASSSASV